MAEPSGPTAQELCRAMLRDGVAGHSPAGRRPEPTGRTADEVAHAVSDFAVPEIHIRPAGPR
ncbi:hypothetical protein [Kitasatospora herbaricolor]|uniref:Uncharacterized protein n=1 Tax=Kitasatospora herbaricolor TaxID=68217 RepID=A0ABZ1W8E9_9ACTN|nr:hypothetical protein [Kitasatospora herbaricolor]